MLENTQKAALGTIIYEPSLIGILIQDGNEFLFSDECRQVYNGMRVLYGEKKEVSIMSLMDQLEDRVKPEFIADLPIYRAHSMLKYLKGDLERYLKRLRQEWLARDVSIKVAEMAEHPQMYTDFVKEVIREASRIDVVDSGIEEGGIEECFKELEDVSEQNDEITVGFPKIDRATGGFRLGEALLFMARTTVGKTFWSLNVVTHLIKNPRERMAFFSLEMPKVSILERLCQMNYSLNRSEALRTLKE